MSEVKKLPAGYVVPVLNSLNRPTLLLGAPFEWSIANLALFVFVAINLKGYLIIVVNIVIQFIGKYMAKKDPFFMKIILRSLGIKSYYDV